jgi:hypothetical protein
MFPFSHYPQSNEKPFRMVLEQQDKKPNGSFTPAARLLISQSIRTSGLLRALPPEDGKSLLFLLTFVSPNGDCRAYLHQLTRAMRLSHTKVRNRMSNLAKFRWQGQPLMYETVHQSGLISYSLSPHFIEYSHQEELATPLQPTVQGGFRDEIIAHSRTTYGRPRREVEKLIARQLGHEEPETEEEKARAEIQRQLENVGISKAQAQKLLAEYDHAKIIQQLEWLPYRNAKNPAAYLAAAIKRNFARPPGYKFSTLEQNTLPIEFPNENSL